MVYTLHFFPLQIAVCFINLTYLVPVLFTFYIQGVLKLKKNNSSARRLIVTLVVINQQCMGEDGYQTEGLRGAYRGIRVNSAPNFTTGLKSAQRWVVYLSGTEAGTC